MKVREIMTTGVITVEEDALFKEIAEALMEHDIGGAPVVDTAGQIVGIVTDGDLLEKEAFPRHDRHRRARLAAFIAGESAHERKAAGLRARDIMTAPPVIVGPDEPVHAAARLMVTGRVHRLPVVEHGRLVGIVSRHDVLRVFAQRDEELTHSVEAFLARSMYVPPQHVIHVSVVDGIVMLRGTVEYASDATVAEALVRTVDGVVEVDNGLGHRFEDVGRKELRSARFNATAP